jgi:general stress protein 26
MSDTRDLPAEARAIIDANRYMTIGTADSSGTPWTTPVYFTPDHYADFYWVSSPAARHSGNIAVRPRVSIVVFDSQVYVGGAQAVYVSATAGLVPDEELERCSAIYNSRDLQLDGFGPADLRDPDGLRLYRASAVEHSMLIRGRDPYHPSKVDTRVPVDPTT